MSGCVCKVRIRYVEIFLTVCTALSNFLNSITDAFDENHNNKVHVTFSVQRKQLYKALQFQKNRYEIALIIFLRRLTYCFPLV
jgi:hypothetical protein